MNIKSLIKTFGNRKVLTENEVKGILSEYKIQTTRYTLIRSKKELEKLTLRYPLALKICSPRFIHKTDVGGVRLNIRDRNELFEAYKEMTRKFKNENFLVEEMEKQGLEVIVGLVDDPAFGLTIMFGLGGVFTELLRDVTFRVVPIERHDAERMLTDLKSRNVLERFRDIKVSREALVNLLLKVSKFAQDFDGYLKELDLNPVFARERNAVVIDARMILK